LARGADNAVLEIHGHKDRKMKVESWTQNHVKMV
jgi:hypothetical protein